MRRLAAWGGVRRPRAGFRSPASGRHPLQLVRRHYDRLWPPSTLSRVGSEPRLSKGEGPGSGPVMSRAAHRSPGGARVRVAQNRRGGCSAERPYRLLDWHSSSARHPFMVQAMRMLFECSITPALSARGNEEVCSGGEARVPLPPLCLSPDPTSGLPDVGIDSGATPINRSCGGRGPIRRGHCWNGGLAACSPSPLVGEGFAPLERSDLGAKGEGSCQGLCGRLRPISVPPPTRSGHWR